MQESSGLGFKVLGLVWGFSRLHLESIALRVQVPIIIIYSPKY